MAENIFKLFRAGMKGPIMPDLFNAEPEGGMVTAEGISRPAWAEIDVEAITHNARVLSQLVRPAQLCAVVKANGYGHGAAAVARAALAGGAIGLAVALVDEGVELRRRGVRGPLLLLSECGADAVDAAMANNLTPTLYTAEGVELFSQAARRLGQRKSVHVKLDTGMHRVGRADGRRRGDPAGRGRRPAAGVRGPVDAPGRGRRGERRRPRLHPRPAGVVRCRADRPRSPAKPCPTWCTPPTRRVPSSIPPRATAWCAAGSVSTAASPARR